MAATGRVLEGSAAPILGRMWWAVMLKAFAIILFGILAFFWVGHTFAGLSTLFAAYAILDGALSVIAAKQGGGFSTRRGFALSGLVSVVAGVAALWPGVTLERLDLIIGGWAVVRGGLEFAAALKLRQVMQRDWTLAAIGGLSVFFGVVVLLISSSIDAWTLVRLLSCYALIIGLLMFVLASRFRKSPRP